MEMIDYRKLDCSVVNFYPMTWALFTHLIPCEAQKELMARYPETGFKSEKRDQGVGKHYCFDMIPLVEKNTLIQSPVIHDFIWKNFLDTLLDLKYISLLEKCLNIDLSKSKINIGLYRFRENHWVQPHVDKKEKIVTQIFYFNNDWNIEKGGFLQLLKDQDTENCFFSLPTLSIYSVAIVRNESAWHSVTPLSNQIISPRLSMQLEFYLDDF